MHKSADFIITLFIILSILTLLAIIYSIFEWGNEKKKPAHTSANTPMQIIPPDEYPVNYDVTAGWIKTHVGTGKYIEYNGNTQKVTLEMDYGYLVELDGRDCYIEPMIDIRV